MIPIIVDELGIVLKGLERDRGLGGQRKNRYHSNLRMNQDHSDHSIVKISQNTEKSPEDLRRLGVIQTPMRDHKQMLV